jgi:hypothetical protein
MLERNEGGYRHDVAYSVREEAVEQELEVVSCEMNGNALIKAMKDAKLSQEMTARRTGVMTSRQLTRIINGENCPSLVRAVALSVVLGKPVDELFTLRIRTRKAVRP